MTIPLVTGPVQVSDLVNVVNQLITAINSFAVANTGNQTISQSSSATALGNTIPLESDLSLTGTGIVSGNGYAERAITTLSGTVTGGAFAAGLRTGMRLSGTMNHADSRLAGAFVKLDDTGATETAGQLSVLWVDHGAGITGAHGGQFNMIRITDTVAGSKGNAVVYAYADASFLLDLGAPSNSISYITTGGGTIGANPVKIAINVNGSTKYLIAADGWT
jgi:hypothetical protein